MRASVLAFLLVLVACGDTDASGPSATSGDSTVTTSEPDLQHPADSPTVVDDPADVARVSTGDVAPLLPPGAEMTFTAVQATPQDQLDQFALAWRRGPDPFASTHGFVVWQRFPGPSWRALYAFIDRPDSGVLGITIAPGDLTGDGVADLLTFEQTGGTGGCGRWRVIASRLGAATEILRRDTCDTEIAIAGGELRIREAVYEAGDPHCCPSAFRVTTLRWDGQDWRETSSQVRPIASG